MMHRPAALPIRPGQFCDRCGLLDSSVATFAECETCGPVPLCVDCRAQHLLELAAETVERGL